MLKHGKHLDFEVNLIPCIDLLSVCICFLLLTAVWLNVGAMNVKQAVGGQAAEDSAKKPVVWVHMSNEGDLLLDVQNSNVPANLRKLKITNVQGKPNFPDLSNAIKQLRTVDAGITTALIQPVAQTAYEDIIDIMDQFKKSGLIDLGVSPL
jgi:biopolymer transport protein TolR